MFSILSGSVESESTEGTESDGWHLVWLLEESDSVFARVKGDSEWLIAPATSVNLLVDSNCGAISDSLEFWETKGLPMVRSSGIQSLSAPLSQTRLNAEKSQEGRG